MEEKTSVVEQALTYLQNKYDQNFTIIASIDGSLDVPYDEMFFQSESYPGEIITVYRKKDHNEFYFFDDFYKVIVNDEYDRLLQSVVSGILNENKIYFNFVASYFPTELDASYNLEEARNSFDLSFAANIYVFVPNGRFDISEDMCKEIESALRSCEIHGYFALYEIEDVDYSSLSKNSYESYLSGHYQSNPVFKVTLQ